MSGQFTFLLTLFCTSDSSLMKFVVIMSSDEFNSCGVDMDDAKEYYREHEAFWASCLPSHARSYPLVGVEWIETNDMNDKTVTEK